MKTVGVCILFLVFYFPGYVSAQIRDVVNDSVEIQDVVVKGHRKYVKYHAGSYVVDVRELRKGKSNLLELLGDVPGVIVSDDQISIIGKGSVRLMLNGRMKNVSSSDLPKLLRSYPASNVLKVEIVKDPGAKYEASNNASILNIITERQFGYFGGTLDEGVRYNQKLKNEFSGNMRYNLGKITSSVNASWDYGGKKFNAVSNYEYPDLTRKETVLTDPSVNNYSLDMSVDYAVDSLSTIGVDVTLLGDHTDTGTSSLTNSFSNDSFESIEILNSKSDVCNPLTKFNLNFYADRQWTETRKLSISLDMFRYFDKRDYDFQCVDQDGSERESFLNLTRSRLHGVSGKMDYSTALPAQISMAVGAQLSLTTTKNTLSYQNTSLHDQYDTSQYGENIYAGYIDLRKTLNRWEFVFGLRYEYTHAVLKDNDYHTKNSNYDRWFPNAHVMYRLNSGSSLDLGTYSGIDRPWLRAVNPFTLWENLYSTSSGNPDLLPSYINNVTLTLNQSWSGFELSTILRYAHSKDIIKQVTLMDGKTTIANTKWYNALNQDYWCINPILSYNGLKWLYFECVGELGYMKTYVNNELPQDNEGGLLTFLYAMARFYLNSSKKASVSLNGTYCGKEKMSVSTGNSYYNVNVQFNLQCVHDKVNLRAGIFNLLANHQKGFCDGGSGMIRYYDNDFQHIGFMVGVSYSFGKDIQKKYRQKSNRSIDERF